MAGDDSARSEEVTDMEFDGEAGREKDGGEAVLIGADAVRERHELALGRIRRVSRGERILSGRRSLSCSWSGCMGCRRRGGLTAFP